LRVDDRRTSRQRPLLGLQGPGRSSGDLVAVLDVDAGSHGTEMGINARAGIHANRDFAILFPRATQ
jgi:hypothetical protein